MDITFGLKLEGAPSVTHNQQRVTSDIEPLTHTVLRHWRTPLGLSFGFSRRCGGKLHLPCMFYWACELFSTTTNLTQETLTVPLCSDCQGRCRTKLCAQLHRDGTICRWLKVVTLITWFRALQVRCVHKYDVIIANKSGKSHLRCNDMDRSPVEQRKLAKRCPLVNAIRPELAEACQLQKKVDTLTTRKFFKQIVRCDKSCNYYRFLFN